MMIICLEFDKYVGLYCRLHSSYCFLKAVNEWTLKQAPEDLKYNHYLS